MDPNMNGDIPLKPMDNYPDPEQDHKYESSPPPSPHEIPQPPSMTSSPAVQCSPHPAPHPAHYPPSGGASQFEMSSNNTVVVTGPPAPLPPVAVSQPRPKPGQHVLVLSLVLIGLCSLTCNFWSLCLLIPGVVFAVVGFNYGHSPKPRRRQTGRSFYGVSLCCSITTIVTFVFSVVCTILFLSIYFGLRIKRYNIISNCFYSGYYYSSYC